jgi:putative endonuclease
VARSSQESNRDRDVGRRGEAAAAEFLKGLGFRIIAKNLRTRLGEVDLLARRRRLYVAVEVKTRAHPAPEQGVSAAQLDRLERTLLALAPHLRPRPRQMRVDVVAVRWTADAAVEIRHFEGPAMGL